jgi:DNA-binding Xre family transcriptional regulator
MKNPHIFVEGYTFHLKQKMVETGVTKADLARKTGYSYEGIRQLLKGNGSYWGIFKICRALKLNIKSIIDINKKETTDETT